MKSAGSPALTKLFCEIAAIPSPSGDELAVSKAIESYLGKHGIATKRDRRGQETTSNSGNLVATLPGTDPALPTLAFVAHMDTVETGERPVRPIVRDGIITSDGSTILGSDNKSAVASLMAALVDIKKLSARPTVIGAFTTHEEKGIMGASFLRFERPVDYVFNVDGSHPIGTIIHRALGEWQFMITVHGRSAHSAAAPRDGRHAIAAAAQLINQLKIGQRGHGGVLSIGVINGGTGTNVVPDLVTIDGEVRAYTEQDLERLMAEVTGAIKKTDAISDCTFSCAIKDTQRIPAYSIEKDSPLIELVTRAAKRLGIQTSIESVPYSTEANILAASEQTVLGLAAGGTNSHSNQETLPESDLSKLRALLVAIAEQALAGKV